MENTIHDAEHFVTFYQDQDGNSFIGNRLFVARMLREYAKQLTISNHNSVRPEVVVPSEEDKRRIYISMGMNGSFGHVWSACIKEIKRLNQTLTFTENHEK